MQPRAKTETAPNTAARDQRGMAIAIPLPPNEVLADLMKVPPPPDKKRRGSQRVPEKGETFPYTADIVPDKQPEKVVPGTLAAPRALGRPYRSTVPQRVGAPKKRKKRKG